MAGKGGFVHLHVHSEYSLLDGACRIKELINRVKELGQDAVAITDHGVMYGVIDFYKEAKKNGVKPIIGCEVYVAPRARFDKSYEYDYENAHLILLCENNKGYENLLKIVSSAWIDGFYNRPRVDRELLEEHSEGLIVLSSCLAGEIPKALMARDFKKAKETALWYENIFGKGNYYLELQDHGLEEQMGINPSIIKLSNETGIPLICTNDVHYLTKEDSKMQEILICIQTNTTVDEPSGMTFSTEEFYLKSEEEMRSLFPEISSAFDNTVKIAERCNVDIVFGETQLPVFNAPGGDSLKCFREECYEGLYKHYGKNPSQKIIDRLEYEIDTISSMGYVDYYLIVNDFVQYAKDNDIPVGPGRGSGAGSLCAYCIGITGIDPIKYNLFFERFLNPERVTMPDFDIDFCNEKRPLVIDYVTKKYGADHVSQIVTFGTMAARSAIRDVARAMGIQYNIADRVAKLIPWQIGITIDEALKREKELKELYDENFQVRDLINMARKVEGMPRHASTHAAGVVITEKPVDNYVPLCLNGDLVATQYPMGTLEELGLLKIDFLGLRNLTVIDDAKKMVQKEKPTFGLEDISLDDTEVFKVMSEGNTEGVFQFESPGMKRVLISLKPDCFEDLIAVISLYRPGPMDSIPKYIYFRHNPDQLKFLHPKLEPILGVTNGSIVYQEQVMQIFRELAGYSLGRADIVRRAMSKKEHDVMEREHEIFVHGLKDEEGNVVVSGCIRRGVSENVAETIFDEISSFASYAFNKAHAAAYAMISYQTAWFKVHFPKEYMASLLTSVLDSSGKVATYIAECNRLGIEVLPPNVNFSDSGFTVTEKGIRFGLLAVKNVGRNLIIEMVKEREKAGVFKSFFDFCKRMSVKRECNVRAAESLIRSGALDGLGLNRRQMFSVYEKMLSSFEEENRRNLAGQIGLFDSVEGFETQEPDYPDLEEFLYNELLDMERELVGVYITGHPLAEYNDLYNNADFTRSNNMLFAIEEQSGEYKDGDDVIMLGILDSVRKKSTKSGEMMAYATLEDLFGNVELLVFPRVFARVSTEMNTGEKVVLKGRLSIRDDEDPKIIVDTVEKADDPKKIKIERFKHQNNYSNNGGKNMNKNKNTVNHSKRNAEAKEEFSKNAGLYLKVSSTEGNDYKRTGLVLDVFKGRYPVYFRFEDTGKLMRVPKEMSVQLNDVLVRELKNILGEESVAVLK